MMALNVTPKRRQSARSKTHRQEKIYLNPKGKKNCQGFKLLKIEPHWMNCKKDGVGAIQGGGRMSKEAKFSCL